MKNKKQLKAGDLVQVWDWYREDADHTGALKLVNHGDLGYLVKRLTETEKHVSGSQIWEVIFFGQDPPARSPVNSSWLHKIDKSSDIKKVEND
tara:strand:+ start:49 stop:327 length:279 start_codon:yes stop_codon:yes gene_type:complete